MPYIVSVRTDDRLGGSKYPEEAVHRPFGKQVRECQRVIAIFTRYCGIGIKSSLFFCLLFSYWPNTGTFSVKVKVE